LSPSHIAAAATDLDMPSPRLPPAPPPEANLQRLQVVCSIPAFMIESEVTRRCVCVYM
jgi:hypothetical protein